jgi:hypothetical protein
MVRHMRRVSVALAVCSAFGIERGARNECGRYATWKDEGIVCRFFAASILRVARKEIKLIRSIFEESSAWFACCGFCS